MKPTRRQFLQQTCLTGMALAVTGTQAADTGIQKFRVLITADLHAQLFTHDEFFWENNQAVFRKRGGLDVLKTMVQRLRAEVPDTILLDAGDYFHGHAIASWTEGQALIPLLQEFQYDILVPGNWEVVYRKQRMLDDLGAVTATKICANMWHEGEDKRPIFQPWTIREAGGVRIGFIGYTDHLVPKRQPPAFSAGIRFTHALESVAAHIRYLREAEKCSVVFVVTHMGLAQQIGLANNPALAGADLIIGADTHERVREPIRGTYTSVVECGAFGSFLGKLDFTVNDGKVEAMNYALLDVDPDNYPADPAMTALITKARMPHRKKLDEIIGYTSTPLMRYFVLETPMDNLITDAIRWKFQPDIALSNGYRFCQPLAVKGTVAPITREFLWNMLPLDSEARTAKVTGKQLVAWLEKELENAFASDPTKRFGGWFVRYSGMKVTFTIGAPPGQRVREVLVGGTPLEADRQYRIVACEREGDPIDTLCRIDKVLEPRSLGVMLHSVVEEYVREHYPVAPVLEGRAVATDQPQTLLTQLQGTTYTFR